MSSTCKILVIDDEPESRSFLVAFLETLGYAVETAASGPEALERLGRGGDFDGVLLDVVMEEMDGIETLRRYRAAGGRCPVIIVSALDQPGMVVQAMRLGASDYVTKPFDAEELKEILERVVTAERPTIRTEPADVARRQPLPREPGSHNSLGDSPAMRRLDELIDRIADSDVPILLTGESGVGKDVASREIHARSPRASHVFVKINCAALPSELLESELFGHEKGSFTGASRTKPGQFELADGGTLFLDEIGEMPPPLQAKLLQALQDGEFYRIGGQRKIRIDVRVIVATNRNLEKAIAEGSFREDLYYRLNVVHFNIPPLRERPEDIPRLIELFVDKYGRRYGRPIAQLPPEVMARFLTYDWPGNIRELENLVRRLMVLQDSTYVLDELKPRPPSALANAGAVGVEAVAAAASAAAGGTGALAGEEENFTADLKAIGRKAAHAAEREAIRAMLAHTAGNKREAAERLGISYKAILYKIREYGIGRPRMSRRAMPAFSPTPTEPAVVPSPEDGNLHDEEEPTLLSSDPANRSAIG